MLSLFTISPRPHSSEKRGGGGRGHYALFYRTSEYVDWVGWFSAMSSNFGGGGGVTGAASNASSGGGATGQSLLNSNLNNNQMAENPNSQTSSIDMKVTSFDRIMINAATKSYAGSMNLGKPVSWGISDIVNAVESANNFLFSMREFVKGVLETGYWLVADNNDNLTAHFFFGENSSTWVGNMGNITLNSNEMLVGFVHLHPDDNFGMSYVDVNEVIYPIVTGQKSWANRPSKNPNTSIQSKQFSQSLDKTFFGCISFDSNLNRFRYQYFSWRIWTGSVNEQLSIFYLQSRRDFGKAYEFIEYLYY